MVISCEIIVRQALPVIRAAVAKRLYAKNFTQEEIARKLNLTQAAVSKYLSGRYTKEMKKLEKDKTVQKISDAIVKNIIKGTFDKSSFERTICKYCKKLLKYSLCSM
jgi:predicted transcriptional regulator